MICIILVAGHETNLDQEIRADQTGQYRHLEGKCVEELFEKPKNFHLSRKYLLDKNCSAQEVFAL